MEFDLWQVDFDVLRNVDVRTVDPDTLTDIRDVKIDKSLPGDTDICPGDQRISDFVRQIQNPYCFKVGKVLVSVGFSRDGVTLEQRMKHYLTTL